MAGGLQHFGDAISAQTVGNILKRHGIPPAPERQKTTTWKACSRTHMAGLVATAFFTTKVWTAAGVVTYEGLCFRPLARRKIEGAGVTPHPDQRGMS
jgi:putative transposase